MTRIEQHKNWMKRKKDIAAIRDAEMEHQCAACEMCGCLGNNMCGHEYLSVDELCTLDDALLCPCCKIVLSSPNARSQPERSDRLESDVGTLGG
ncbi:MAG: hypothetical protein WC551_13780 [Patescibacteria group bacterium]